MAADYKRVIADVSGGNYIPVTSGNYYLRVYPFASNTYTGVHQGNGVWSFGNVATGLYQLWNATSQVERFGTQYIINEDGIFRSLTLNGNLDLNGYNINNGNEITCNKIFEKVTDGGVTIDGILLKDSLDISNIVTKSTNQTITGNKTFSGVATFSGGPSVFSALPRIPTTTPERTDEVVSVKYLNDVVGGLVMTPFQEAAVRVRCIPGGTTEPGKVYTTLAAAISYFSSPAVTKQCYVDVYRAGTTQFVRVTPSSQLVNYVHIRDCSNAVNGTNTAGQQASGILLSGGSASTTKSMSFINCNLYIGDGDSVGARTFNSMTFRDCIIWSYQRLTFTNCKLINCIIYQGTGNNVTVDGSTEMFNCILTQEVLQAVSFTGLINNTTSEVSTGYSMPADPSVIS